MSGWLSVLLVALLLLCWAVGAYQRLLGLRTAVTAAFGPVADMAQRLGSVVHAALDLAVASAVAPGGDPQSRESVDLLRGALMQSVAALAVAQSRPLPVESIDALNAAQALLHQLWGQRWFDLLPLGAATAPAEATDPGGQAQLPARLLQEQWQQAVAQYDLTATTFNQQVQTYNHAIHQFPARLLAWCFGLAAARELALQPAAVATVATIPSP